VTSRERIVAVLQGDQVDRTPIAPFVYGNVVREWKKDSEADVIGGTIDFCKHFSFDCILRNFSIRNDDFAMSTDNWSVSKKEKFSGNIRTIITKVQTPGGILTQTGTFTQLSENQNVFALTEHMIKEPNDFALIELYMPQPSQPDLTEARRARNILREDGITAPWIPSVFNYLSSWRALDDLVTDPITNPELYGRMARYAENRLKLALAPVFADVDMISYVGNIATGSMVGPKFFDVYVLPYEKSLVDFIQANCKGVIYHNCGDAANMIDCYNKLAPICYESMTEPPFGDNSLEECMRRFSPDITLMGNIDQVDFLRNATPEEVYSKARQLVEMSQKRGHFILGTTDLLEEGTPHKNLHALAQAVLP